jgi:peptidoglycan L-alanyl-D-glutamate endopeptidase CwlK
VVKKAIQITTQDFAVLEGLRTPERQAELYAQGRTAPGPVVTWTMDSPHLHGRAVDLVPYPVDWNDLSKFDAIAKAMITAADEVGVKLRWGADWDMDGKPREKGESDSPHFELA